MSEKTVTVQFNDQKMKALMKALRTSKSKIKVGILGDDRNATIGAVHEFGLPTSNGDSKYPVRSFLRVPLSQNLQKELVNKGINIELLAKQIIDGKDLKPLFEKIGIAGVACVLEAFASQGPGWASWKNPKYQNNANMILQNTGQLKNSITYEVK